jgi:hypothetical protein
MGSFLALAIGIIVFAMLVFSTDRVKKRQEGDKENN